MQKIVTVFGGSGLVGRYIVKRLAQAGYIVRVAVRYPEKAKFLTTMGMPGQVTLIAAPLQSEAAVRAAINGADIVVNAAGIMFRNKIQTFQAIHTDAVEYIARAVRDNEIDTMIHISALGIEKMYTRYALTKKAGEEILLDYVPHATILRPSLVIGEDDHFVSLFAKLLQWLPVVPLVNGGQTKFQPVYVEDVANFVHQVIEKREFQGKVYAVAGREVYTMRELIEIIKVETGLKAWLPPLPQPIAYVQALMCEILGLPIMNRAALKMLRVDNIMDDTLPSFKEVGLSPASVRVLMSHFVKPYMSQAKRAALDIW